MFVSCQTKKSTNQTQEIVKEIFPSDFDSITSHFEHIELPFKINHAFFLDSTKNHTKRKLALNEVELLSEKMNTDSLTENCEYYRISYRKIENVKQKKQYESYIESLDIGMMQDAEAFALYTFTLGDSVGVLIWKIHYDSYPACPMFTGDHVYASVFSSGNLIQSSLIASMEYSADAPITNETFIEINLDKNGKFRQLLESITSEEENTIEQYKMHYNGVINSKGFVKK